ncbi:hypothetical protein J6S39_00975 [Candidatus Saccharibacteria bacterium]|nr:hypothetical protein [Candidatus Saccharibacteria bacterium]
MLPVLSSKNGIVKNVDPKFNKRDVRAMSYMLTCLDSDIKEDELNELLSYSFKQSGNVLTEDEIQSLNELLTNLKEICELEEAHYSRFRRDKKVIYERYYEYLFKKRRKWEMLQRYTGPAFIVSGLALVAACLIDTPLKLFYLLLALISSAFFIFGVFGTIIFPTEANRCSDRINNDREFVDYWNNRDGRGLTKKQKDKIVGDQFYSDLIYDPTEVKRAREYMRIIKDFIEKYTPHDEDHLEKTQG